MRAKFKVKEEFAVFAGRLLRTAREKRGLSLREMSTLSAIDHAYIHRLETGDKSKPGDEIIEALQRVLRLGHRQVQVLRLLFSVDSNALIWVLNARELSEFYNAIEREWGTR